MAEPLEQLRYCPICGDRTSDFVCKKDGVRTLDATRLRMADGLAEGTVIAERYQIEQKLGEGAMGTVYEAIQLTIGRTVALKVMGGVQANEVDLRRFHREAKSASFLRHPNVVSVHDFGFDESLQIPFLAMELLSGRTLGKVIKAEAPLDPARTLAILEQITRGLVAAHRAGIVHRDLKPDNVMVGLLADGEEHVTVLDFGIAKEIEVGTKGRLENLTASGVIVGTPRYMSPEQINGISAVPQSDLYSLGCIMFEMLTGAPPFVADDVAKLLLRHSFGPRPPLPLEVGDRTLPRGFSTLFDALVHAEVDQRPSSAAAVLSYMRALRAGEAEPDPSGLFADRAPSAEVPAPEVAARTDESSRSDTGAAERHGPGNAVSMHVATDADLQAEGEVLRSKPAKRPLWLPLGLVGVVAAVILGAFAVSQSRVEDAPMVVRPQAKGAPPPLTEGVGGPIHTSTDIAPPPKPAPAKASPAPEPEPPTVVELRSSPGNAAVLRGRKLLGRTPLTLPLPEVEETWSVRKRGYAPETVRVGPDTGSNLDIELRSLKSKRRPEPPKTPQKGEELSPI